MQGKLATVLPELGGEISFRDSLPSGVFCSVVLVGVEKSIPQRATSDPPADTYHMPPQELPLNKSKENIDLFIESIDIYYVQIIVKDADEFKTGSHAAGVALLCARSK